MRGPTLLEDFILREKITHFDHERIPERIVHARGSAAHGYFELTRPLTKFTTAKFLTEKGRIPVFCRFSTVAGGAGSVDTPRDVRGFAVKFYTQEGNFDLVGNNLPVFAIQDAMKFPDFIHEVKMEPDRGFPQAASAHDTFWDFVSLSPETLHMVLWAMSDRGIPRSTGSAMPSAISRRSQPVAARGRTSCRLPASSRTRAWSIPAMSTASSSWRRPASGHASRTCEPCPEPCITQQKKPAVAGGFFYVRDRAVSGSTGPPRTATVQTCMAFATSAA